MNMETNKSVPLQKHSHPNIYFHLNSQEFYTKYWSWFFIIITSLYVYTLQDMQFYPGISQ